MEISNKGNGEIKLESCKLQYYLYVHTPAQDIKHFQMHIIGDPARYLLPTAINVQDQLILVS